jgi:predicted RNA-binding Zn-ribbon protein involved in translation (DUF1610 family)
VREANCPSCGASIPFKAGSSVFAICGYCQSMVLRKGAALEDLGKISEVMDDGSPVRLGMTGKLGKRDFQVAGRIQLKWQDGIWNEWFLLFSDNETGWLGEGQGMFFVTFQKPAPQGVIPGFEQLAPGQKLTISGKPFQVSWKETSRCVSGEGELPFAVHDGWESPSVDLMGPGGTFLTFDYSDDPPSLYVGEEVKIESLALDASNAVPEKVRKVATESMACLSCGAPYTPHGGENASWGCPTCGAVHDVLAGKLQTIYERQNPPDQKAALELGMVGKFEGYDWTVVGIMRRASAWKDDEASGGWASGSGWFEYLLWNAEHGQRWLSESDGHWNLLRTVPAHLAEGSQAVMPGAPKRAAFRHFATYNAITTWVVGEFDWRVKVGDRFVVSDHVAPPWILGCERNERESVWSAGPYLDRGQVLSAFEKGSGSGSLVGNVALPPPPNTVFANQPNPYADKARSMGKLLWKFLLAAFLIHLVVSGLHPSGSIARTEFAIQPENPTPPATVSTETVLTDSVAGSTVEPGIQKPNRFSIGPFAFPSNVGNIVVSLESPIYDDWMVVDATLTDRITGRTWNDVKEISYYTGMDSDGSWSEGSQTASIRFDGLEKGEYLLELEIDRDPAKQDRLDLRVNVKRNKGSIAWFFLAALVLILFPITTIFRSMGFESRRWADSDHGSTSTNSDNDGFSSGDDE